MLGLQRKSATTGQVVQVNVNQIVPNRSQPRKSFDQEELQQLANSIRENGILQPIIVRQNENQQIELVSGERRLRASKLVGLEHVPCIFIDIHEQKAAVFALLENMQRSDLNFFEEAEGIERLMNEFGFTQEMCAVKLGKAQSTLSNKMRLLRINPEMRKTILENNLTERHARAILKLPTDAEREIALVNIVQDKLNVSMTEKLVAKMLNQFKKGKQPVRVVKDVRIFLNTLNNAVEIMRKSGIQADTYKTVKDDYIEYTVKIPKTSAHRKS